jgi:hypothetical protein
MNKYAHRETSQTIQSIFSTIIDDGLPYSDMDPPTDEAISTYTHGFFSSETTWEPQTVNYQYPAPLLDSGRG